MKEVEVYKGSSHDNPRYWTVKVKVFDGEKDHTLVRSFHYKKEAQQLANEIKEMTNWDIIGMGIGSFWKVQEKRKKVV